MITKKFPNGYSVDLVSYYPRLTDWYITAEQETLKWLGDNVQPDWECIEVGAHIGYTSMFLSRLSKRVIAFEPNPRAVEMFKENVAYNTIHNDQHYDNIELYSTAVGSFSGRVQETLWLTGEDDTFGKTEGEFDFVTIDDFLHNQLTNLGLLFVDADGWDFDVLLGAQNTIKKFRPSIIIESNYALGWRNHNGTEVQEFAAKYGYTTQWLDAACPGNLLFLTSS